MAKAFLDADAFGKSYCPPSMPKGEVDVCDAPEADEKKLTMKDLTRHKAGKKCISEAIVRICRLHGKNGNVMTMDDCMTNAGISVGGSKQPSRNADKWPCSAI